MKISNCLDRKLIALMPWLLTAACSSSSDKAAPAVPNATTPPPASETAVVGSEAQPAAPAPVAPAPVAPAPAAPAGMLIVPKADYSMGCNAEVDKDCSGSAAHVDGQSPKDEFPYHAITVSSFWLDTTPVTQTAFALCVQAGACTAPSDDWHPDRRGNYPVHFVTWPQAQAYCAWSGKRLPSEAEYELASRGTDGRIYPWGNEAPDCSRVNFAPGGKRCVAMSDGTSTEAVGLHANNAGPYGHLDLSGNVWEWMSDWYAADFYASSPLTDPVGPATAEAHSKRGGSLIDEAYRLRSSRRWSHPTNSPVEDVGFRCAKSL